MTQNIEQTGKFWKFFTAMGALAIVVGLGGMLFGEGADNSDWPIVWTLALFGGLGGVFFGKVGGWWFHG